MGSHRITAVFLIASFAVACHGTNKHDDSTPDAAPVASVAPAASSASALASATPPPAPTPAPVPKKYTRVLQTGDSMVGGGLSLALRPMFEADGAKYHRDVIESGTIHEFAQNDHLPGLIASFKPDLILLTLGANHVPHSIDPDKELGPYLPKLIKRVSGIDCYWIAPPLWKPATQAKFNEWLKEHVAPCRFYDSSSLDIARRPDKIHPNEKGGAVWAADFWRFYKGEGAFYEANALAPKAEGPTLTVQ
jgi:hypothetical protein